MKILHVITSLNMGGAEKLMVDLLPRFKEAGIVCDLLTFDGTRTPFRQSLEEADVQVYDFGKPRFAYSLWNFLKLIPFLRRYDIVHTHNTAPQLFAAIGSLFCSVKLVTTEHSTFNRRRDWKWYAAFDRWMYSRYKRVICISPQTEKNLRGFIGDSRTEILTIDNGIDVSTYSEALPLELKSAFSGCDKALIQVASFRTQKDQKTVIHALKSLSDTVHLFFVGDGDLRQECEDLAAELDLADRVHFLGLRADVAALLKGADIVVMSSHNEGFGLAAVEGMAAGKPVVASDVDGLREVVEGAGLLFKCQDPADLAEKIQALLSSGQYYDSVASACRKRAEQYDISRMTTGYIFVYNSTYNER